MRRLLSERVGLMIGPDHAPRRAYRALVELSCARCGASITPGEVFARARDKARSARLLPHCARCLPLRQVAQGPPHAHADATDDEGA